MKLLLAVPLAFAAGGVSAACEAVAAGDLTVSAAWSRATIGADRPGVVYLTVENAGVEDDALVGLSTPVASMPMLHETVVEDGVATMPHAMAVPIPAGGTAALAPGGFHAMLMGLEAPLEVGATFLLTLTFERAGEVTVEAEVLPIASQGPNCL